MGTTRLAIRTRVRTKLADTDSANYVWSDTELDNYLQDAYDLFCRSTYAIFDRVYIPDVAGEGVYDLPETTVKLDRVTWDDYRIRSMPQTEFMYSDQSFEAQMGPVIAYLADGDGAFRIRKIRIPSEDHPTKFLAELYRLGALLTSDSDVLEISDWDCRALVFYVLSQAYQRDGPGQSLDTSAHYLTRWIEALERVRGRNYKVQSRRIISIGEGGESIRPSRVPRPQLPWNFGTPVRMRRSRR